MSTLFTWSAEDGVPLTLGEAAEPEALARSKASERATLASCSRGRLLRSPIFIFVDICSKLALARISCRSAPGDSGTEAAEDMVRRDVEAARGAVISPTASSVVNKAGDQPWGGGVALGLL